MNSAKLNTKIRRFFDRLGGGGVKALKVKDNTGFGKKGSGSEDAQKLFEMFFGQVPYVFFPRAPESFEVLPITEYSTEELLELCNTFFQALFMYKEQEPVAGAYCVLNSDQTVGGINITVRPYDEVEMIPVPLDIPNGPWYYPEYKADIDLSSFPLPTEENPTTLTGVEIPQKEQLVVRQRPNGTVTYHWNSGKNQYELDLDAGTYTIKFGEISWVWSLLTIID